MYFRRSRPSRNSALRSFALLAAAATGSLVVSGCGGGSTPSAGLTPAMDGNWAFAANSGGSSHPMIGLNAGFSTVRDGTTSIVTGVAHLTGASCVDAKTNIALAGSISAAGKLTLTSQPFEGTTLALRGTLASDGKSIADAEYSFAGGACASLASGVVTAAQYASISGNYAGNFQNTSGDLVPVTATLTQTSQPDSNGQFHLSGSATFANSACFAAPIITDSLVTGSSLSTTYSSTSNGQTATITAAGTFNADASQLTISNWQVAGGLCDGATGTGLLTKQN